MVKNIFITNDNKKDNIAIYEKEPVYVVHFERKDFDPLKKIEEVKQPGVYILIGDNQRYVGQASNSVLSRLSSHVEKKDFWTSALFFGRNDGVFDKSQLDYIEEYYINQFEEEGFIMDNSKGGNKSKIQKLNRIKADEIISIFKEVIMDVANIDLFSLVDDVESNAVSNEKSEELFVAFDGKVISNKVLRSVEKNFVRELLNNEITRGKLLDYKVDGKASSKNKLGSEAKFFSNGLSATEEIEPGLFLWVHQTKEQTSVAIKKIAEIAGIEIEMNF